MATSIPNVNYITGMVLSQLVTWLTQKLYTEIAADDAARALLIKIGPRQQDPVGVGLFLYENDLEAPDEWPHGQDMFVSRSSGSGLVGAERAHIQRLPLARQTIGSDPEWLNQRCFTIMEEVWLERIPDIARTEENLARLSSIVGGRVRSALKDGGLTIGLGQAITDDLGEMVIDGPFFGTEYAQRQVGQSMFTTRYLRFWYRTSES